MSVQKKLLCPFHCKARPSGVSLESPGLENIPQVPENQAKVGQNYDARRRSRLLFQALSEVGLYSPQKLEGERLKCFALSISMQTKAIGS